MRLTLTGGRVIDPANQRDVTADVYIADGRIVSVGARPDGFEADRDINAAGLVVCPGLIDLCARLREPGLEHKATIASETAAAAASGVTTLCCPPDTAPIIDTPAVARLVAQRAKSCGHARVATLGALTWRLGGKKLSEMAALRDAGCVGVTNVYPLANAQIMRRAMEYAATYGLTLFLNPVDPWLSQGGCAHEGAVSTRLGLPGIPSAAETVAVARDLALIAQTGVRGHFCRLSTAHAVRMIARARYDGLPVSADVCAHQLHLTELDVMDFDAQCHVLPPLRTAEDQEGLRAGVEEGVISAVCSDHQPHEADAKLAPFCATAPGVSALETLLPLTLALVEEHVLKLDQAIARLTCGPADILGMNTGRLSPGARADICIFDPDAEWILTADTMRSQGHNSPFLGNHMKGQVVYTLVGGRCVFERNGTVNGPAEMHRSATKQTEST